MLFRALRWQDDKLPQNKELSEDTGRNIRGHLKYITY